MLEKAAAKQNLKKHRVKEGASAQYFEIFGPTDIEIHRGHVCSPVFCSAPSQTPSRPYLLLLPPFSFITRSSRPLPPLLPFSFLA
jgi:hypothetical protein